MKIGSGRYRKLISIEAQGKVDTEDVTGTRARSMYGQSAVFPRLPVIQSAKWKDRNGLWFGFGIIHYAAHNTPSPATAVLHSTAAALALTAYVSYTCVSSPFLCVSPTPA
ncbi:hypothetical protein KPH14_011951 [Odynerus spinipes]|uniref:Uncharacterized protein n=1 Tax=Odynerus spinipes TaxID=1348599 RepID=A0AAD9RC28_9HYME|nr:hypothetical protein KPH14_011951 [Odynerus spinipes]